MTDRPWPHPEPYLSPRCRCDAGESYRRGVCQPCYSRWQASSLRARRRKSLTAMRNRDAHHLTRIRRTYGLTPAQYYELLEHQGYRCALCGVHERELPERLCIDHCHDTGIVRGALCRSCNASVGSAEKHGTAAHAGYLAWPPTKELAHRKAHPDGPHPA